MELVVICGFALIIRVCSCPGCSHELNLHRPVVVDEAEDFFKSVGVSDFTFDSCRLVRISRCSCAEVALF